MHVKQNHLSDGRHVIKFKATDKDGNSAEREVRIGVNTAWDYVSPTPTPTASPTPTSTQTPTQTSTPTPTSTVIVTPTVTGT